MMLSELRTTAKMKMLTMTMMMMMMMLSGALQQSHACDDLYKPLPTKDLNQVFGEWRLLWGAAEWMTISDLANSAVSLHPKSDLLIHLLERNKYRDNTCVSYSLNLTAPADPTSEGPLVMQAVVDRVVSNGSLLAFNISFTLHFYERSPDAMLMFVQAGELGRFLLSYTRAGHEVDMEQLKSEQEKLLKMVECLSFVSKPPFIYDDAAAEVCSMADQQAA
ncbi:saxitoxin and tetrodotoxin-binding protein 1-like isoform X2 [Hippocampus comes]|uniref:Saxitoxin and tetrodotoxin-binding protein 1-like n=1 Tax=Hippocampus comes TaxID=109280 RepID=A0A3Q2XLT2_HIPCM|nr:PREDICTED: saxitoxin and tetrodotoxin-binding protein 1-like isoform X2 [Hippocampus comes]